LVELKVFVSSKLVTHSDITKKFKIAAINRKWTENIRYISFT